MRIVKLLLFLVSLLLVRVDVYAYDFKVNGLCYNKLSDSTVELTWEDIDKPYTGDIVVPDCVDYSGKRYDVVAIGDYAFVWLIGYQEGGGAVMKSNNKLSSVLLPTTITLIGKSAFRSCSGLTSITIPNSVTSIGESAFDGCSSLTSITIPNSVTSIGRAAFFGCSGLNSINVASGNTHYDSRNDCNAIIETSTNTLISGCKNTTIPNSVTSIGIYAFWGCSSLTSIRIPSSVTTIEGSAFMYCSGLTSITIPNSVTSIGISAFSDCSGLTSITIPNSVTSIGDNAFSACIGLTSITIPNSVTSIGKHAFNHCSGLTSIKSEITDPFTIFEDVFSSSSYTEATLTVPYGTKAKYQSTEGWNKFANIVESDGSENVQNKRTIHVAKAGTLSNFISNDEKYQIEELTLTGELNGTDFRLLRDMAGNNYLGELTGGSLTYLNISAATIVSGGDKYLDTEEITISPGGSILNRFSYSIQTNEISQYLFCGCLSLQTLILPNSVTSIGEAAVSYCRNLTMLVIPNSVTSIGGWAFWGCDNLQSVTIPASVTSIGIRAFISCPKLDNIIVEEGNNNYVSLDGVLFNKSMTTLIHYPIGKTSTTYKIPSTVQSINELAFEFSNTLTYIGIPEGLNSIGYASFYGCSSLMSLKLPNSLNYIGSDAFRQCSGLTSITIPNSVTSIDERTFYDCSGLTSITIPNSVTSIGERAFSECSGLTSIISRIQNPFVIKEDVFDCWSKNIYAAATLTVPKGTKAVYQSTEGWNKFANIVEEGNTDEVMFTIDGTTFQGSHSNKTAVVNSVDTKLKTLEIPASVSYNGTNYQVTGITDNAFSGCTMAALIWNADAALPSNAFSSASIGSNFLLYVNSASYAPSNVKNVVVDGIAQTILLSDDGGNFYCPEGFTAQSISYTHNYSMATGGNGKGWEALALPFDVKNIEHKTKGTLTPFALYDSSNSSQRPFWLYELGSNGFIRSSGIRANTPYIIAMPNNTSYDSDYILTGDVTFSASNAQVYETSSVVTATSGSKRFVPAFSAVEKSSDVYTLNVSNQKVLYSGSYDKGSLFISNLRSTYPFEAYMTTSSSATRTRSIGIEFDDDATAIDIVPATGGETDIVKVYSINGILVLQTDHKSLQKQWESLPAGVYIVNGKKVLK